MNRLSPRWITALLVFLALCLRVPDLNWGFPEVYEEATPVREAIEMWGKPDGSIDLNPHFFKYPSLTIYLNLLLQFFWFVWLGITGSVQGLNDFRAVLASELTTAVAIGRGLQVVLGSLLVIPAVLLGTRLGGSAVGWIAGALVAVLPVAVRESRIVSPDMALALGAGAAIVAATDYVRTGRRECLLWGGVWTGLAAASKYPGALLVPALVVAHVLARRRAPRPPAWSVLPQGIVIAFVVFAAATPYVLMDAKTALQDLRFEARHMVLGHLGREEGRALLYYLKDALPRGWTPVVAVGAVLGIARLLESSTRALAVPGAVFALTLLVSMGGWRMAAPRYVLPLLPLGAVWAASLADVAPRRLPGARGTVAAALVGAALLALPLAATVGDLGGRGRLDSRAAAAQWIAEHVPAGKAILVERYGPEPDPETYIVLSLPFHAVTPHLYDGAYSLPLYATFDVVVLSSAVSQRFLAQPREYPAQAQFYHGLERAFEELAAFDAGDYAGPTIRILGRRAESGIRDLSGMPGAFYDTHRGNAPLAEHLSTLGTALVRQGRDDLGFLVLGKAVEMAADNAQVWGNLGAMRLRRGQFEDAVIAFRRAEALDPRDARIALDQGILLDRMREHRQAADAYRRAIALDPGQETAFLGLARALVADDRYAEARAVLREFLDRFPRSPRRPAAEGALRELQDMGAGRP